MGHSICAFAYEVREKMVANVMGFVFIVDTVICNSTSFLRRFFYYQKIRVVASGRLVASGYLVAI